VPPASRSLRLAIALAGVLSLPVPAQEPLFTFVQISDSQPQTTQENQSFVDVLQKIAQAGQPGALLPRAVDLVLFAGDITWGNTQPEWIAARQKLDAWLTANDIPYRAVPGNHDVNNSDTDLYEFYIAESDPWDIGSAEFTGHNGPSRTTGWKGLRFIGVNNSNPGWNTVSAADVADVDSRVAAAAAASENVFLLCHHPHNEKDRVPLAGVLPEPAVIGYLHGHLGSPGVTPGLAGIVNPNVWDVNSNAIYRDRVLVYFEVFPTELHARVIFIDTTTLPAAVLVPLLHPLTPLSEPSFGTPGALHQNARPSPSGESPERKLWHHAGSWWAILWSDAAAAYRIHRLDAATQTWTDTGTEVSIDPARSFDALSEGGALLVASNVSVVPSAPGGGSPGFLHRFAYDPGQNQYALDPGFPVAINDARSETLVLARDSLGTLWATWTESGMVVVNHSLGGDDSVWGTPVALASGLAADDTSALVPLGGTIGVLWPQAAASTATFALHVDGDPDGSWTFETALTAANLSGDALDLVAAQGRALAVVGAADGSLSLLERSNAAPGAGVWSVHEAAAAGASLHDPALVVDEAFGLLRLFATGPTLQGQSLQGGGAIYQKLSDLALINFPHGRGTPMIQDGMNPSMGFATTTRQAVTGASGLAVLASNAQTERYWHAFDDLAVQPGPPAADFSGDPLSGVQPLVVQFTDLSSVAPTDWLWDFGDGATSSEQDPQHVYAQAGAYTVSLRAANGAGEDVLARTDFVTVAAPPPVAVFNPIADARVYEGSPSSNQGLDITLRVKTQSGSSYRSYLKFDLTSVSTPVQSAVLRLFCTDPSNLGGSVYLVSDNSWTETGITWNNKPALPASPLTTILSVTAGVWTEIDVSGFYSGPGTYTLALAGGGTNSALYSSREGTDPPELVLTLTGAAQPPVADFSGTPLNGPAPLTVSFTDLSANGPTAWSWDFGDGGTSTARNPTHVYTVPGTYTVLLDVTNNAGLDSLTRLDYVTVGDPLPPPPVQTFVPVADTRVSESNPTSNFGLETTLRVRSKNGSSQQSFLRFDLTNLSASVLSARLRLFVTDASPSGGTLYAISDHGWSETGMTWNNRPALPASPIANLGSVSLNTWVEIDVVSVVTGPGLFDFALAGGNSNSALYSSRQGANPPELVIETGVPPDPDPPVADFSGTPLSGDAPLQVSFTDLSTQAATWLWTFGDGATSTVRNPSHTYTVPGTYTVTLEVTNAAGSDSLTRPDFVVVSEAPPPPPMQVFPPVADARVYEGSPGSNYGADVALRVRSTAGGSYNTYLRFDVASLAGPVLSARLRLFVTDGSDVGGIVSPTASSWSETGITWSNQPGPSGPQVASAGTVATGVWLEIDVTSAVTGPGVVSFVLTSTSSNSCLYSSREGANPPELVVTTAAP
jgi:PKD repeat protein